MKTLWNVVSFLAVVHLLALVLFVVWLWQSDRLSRDRMESLRDLLAPTLAEAEAAAEASAKEAESLRAMEEADARRRRLPMSSEMQIEHIGHLEEIEQRAIRRLKSEREHLTEQLASNLRQLQSREAEFEAERRAWEEAIAAERERRTDEQFAKAVRQLESVPPRQGKAIMVELVRDNQIDQAVAYLDAMNARASSKILEQFRTDEEVRLATELLERLRRFGIDAELARDEDHADRIADAQ